MLHSPHTYVIQNHSTPLNAVGSPLILYYGRGLQRDINGT